MKRLDYNERVALRSFTSVKWVNRTLTSEEVGDGNLALSARLTALSSLVHRGLVAQVAGGYTLTYEGIQERDRLEQSWVDARTSTEQQQS